MIEGSLSMAVWNEEGPGVKVCLHGGPSKEAGTAANEQRIFTKDAGMQTRRESQILGLQLHD